jgi:hypothetical protein
MVKATEELDTEGQMFLPDAGTNRHLANSRSAEIERNVTNSRYEKDVLGQRSLIERLASRGFGRKR